MSPKILPLLLLIFVKVNCEDVKSSLVFVFDTTGSMYNDLKQLREGAEMILKTALEEGNVVGDFVFVPFHDPSVGPATVTQDKEVLKAALERVQVYGGGDCPEKSLGGIQLALDVSQARSYVYVFTDATAGDHRLVGKVLDAVQRKQSQVVFVLTGHCNDLDKPSYKVYHQIAAASSGQVFNLNKTSVHKVLDFVRSSIKGRMVNLGSSVNPAGSNTQEVPVDSSLGEVTVSVSGARPRITVLDPNGTLVTPPQLVTTLDLAEIMVVKVMQPEPGNWTITVGSDEDYSVKVSGLSNLTFNHSFSVEKPRDMAETSYRPLKGTYNHMMISLTQKTPPVVIEFAEILSMNGSTLFELPLREVDAENKVYLAEAFIPPEEFFYVAINGKDEHNQLLKRIGSTAVQAKVPDVPYLTTSRRISAHAHSRVVLKCKVDSLVPVTAMWTKNTQKLQPLISSLQTTTIEYVIEDLTEDKTGPYKCFAKNVAGVGKAATEVSIIVEPPQVSFEPANLTLEEGDNATLTCTIFSEALLLSFKMDIDLPGARSTKINVEPSIDGVYQFNKTIVNASGADAGTYTCTAVNRGGSTNQSATISIAPKPTVQIIGPHTMTKGHHTIAQLYCQADNCDTVTWMQAGRVVKESAVGGMLVLEVNVTEDGVWRCVGKRGRFEASDSVEITVLMKPSVTIAGDKNIIVLNGTVYELVCEVTGKPPPRVIWHRETEEFLNHTLTNPKANTYLSKLTLDSSVENVQATYFCYGENSEGVMQDHVQVNVRRGMTVVEGLKVPPLMEPPLEMSKDVLLGDDVNLQCDAVGFPIPSMKWAFNEVILMENNTDISFNDIGNLYITIASSKHEGIYACVAENLAGSVNKFIKLNVNELPKILEDNYTGPYLATTLDSALTIACKASGKPKPYVVWSKAGVYLNKDSQYEVGKDATLTIRSPTEDMSGNYTCTAKNKYGAANKTVTVEVYSLPTVQQSIESQLKATVVEHENATVECPIRASDGDTVKWYKDAELITTGPLYLANVTRKHQATYACVVTNAVGSAFSSVHVNVEWPPTFIDNIENTKTDDHSEDKDDAKLKTDKVVVENLEEEQVTNVIDKNETVLNDERHKTLKAVNVNEDNGKYITIRKEDVQKTRNGHNNGDIKIIEVVKGDDVNLDCQTDAKPLSKIKWLFNSKPILFQNNNVLKLLNVRNRNAGTYKCVAANAHGSVHRLFNVDVLVPPFISEFDVMEVSLIEGSNATLECYAKGYPQPSLRWTYNNTNWHLEDASLTTANITQLGEGVYRCDAANKAGATHIAYAVTVVSAARVEDVVLFEGGGGVSVGKSLELALGAHVRVACQSSGKPAPTVKWLRNGKLLGENIRGVNYADLVLDVETSTAGVYSCVVANEAGEDRRSVRVEVLEPPKIIRNRATKLEVLTGQPYYLHCHALGNPAPQTYWFKDDLPLKLFDDTMVMEQYGEVVGSNSAGVEQSGVYTCVQRNRVGNDSVAYEVTVLVPPPQPKDTIKSVKVRINKPLTLTCPVEGTPAPAVMWIKHPYTEVEASSRVALTDDNVTLFINHTQVSDSGNYSCIMGNAAGSAELVFIIVVLKPPSIVGGEVERVVPLRRSLVLKCEADGHPLPTITWLKDTQKLSPTSSNIHPVLGNNNNNNKIINNHGK